MDIVPDSRAGLRKAFRLVLVPQLSEGETSDKALSFTILTYRQRLGFELDAYCSFRFKVLGFCD